MPAFIQDRDRLTSMKLKEVPFSIKQHHMKKIIYGSNSYGETDDLPVRYHKYKKNSV